ncbi:right-handed parallel beta-helix repeat-containing protein, partial [bacterium]|nr:right-handed parallel beta-helix repeat-containing protein [bacterium]
AAITAASAGDVIKIHAEEYPEGSEHIIEYNEHVIVNKELTVLSPHKHEYYGWPVIKLSSFTTYDEVIRITEAASDTEISNLIIRGPVDNNTGCPGYDPIDCMDEKVGIRLEAKDCVIDNCKIIFCMTGIYMESTTGNAGTGNVISNCRIGDQWWVKVPPDDYYYQDYWTEYYDGDPLDPIDHPGNGFGIVMVEPDWDQQSGETYTNRHKNEIVDCTIRSNRYYGVVLTNGSRAHIVHNIIAWNGDFSAVVSADIPDKTGGLLSLFTSSQIFSNSNKLQAPTILSNTIYGNKGHQIGVFTDMDDCRHIYNSPVIIGNTIGIEDDMPVPQGNLNDYEYLISCGPTPDITATPTLAGPTPTATPAPGQFTYSFHGSGPVLAWNNLHDTSNMGLTIYHPMQRNNKPPRQTFTPTMTPTPIDFVPTSTPTPTPRQPTPAPFSTESMPTGIPWSPTPTPQVPSPTYTPLPLNYDANSVSWRLKSINANPQHKGWRNDSQEEPPRYYDWHLLDHDGPNPSDCFNKGGLFLNPGSAQYDSSWDSGFVDLGRHIFSCVPPVNSFGVSKVGFVYHMTWSKPLYWSDGSIFQQSDIGGYVILYGYDNGIGKPGQIEPIGQPVFLSSSCLSYSTGRLPVGTTHLGVYLYDTKGMDSLITWKPKPTVGR